MSTTDQSEQDFLASHRIGDRREVRHGAHLITQVFGRDGWWNIKVESAR
jgi:hypothetical protein